MKPQCLLTKYISEQRRPVILKSPKSGMLFPPIFMLSDVWRCADKAADLESWWHCPLAMSVLLEWKQAGSLRSSQEALIKGSPWKSSAEGSTHTYNRHGGTQLKSSRGSYCLPTSVTKALRKNSHEKRTDRFWFSKAHTASVWNWWLYLLKFVCTY